MTETCPVCGNSPPTALCKPGISDVAQPAGMREALRAAKCHLITLGGDPRPNADEGSDEIQIAVLDVIDAALATQPPDTAVEREPCYSTIETCFDCGVREPCDEDCPNHVEPEPVSRSSAQSVSEPIGYAPYHPKHGWRIDLCGCTVQLAECYAMRNIESAAQQGWTIQPLYAAQPPAAPVEPSAWRCPACEAAVVVDDPTPADAVEMECDTVKHMWGQVEKARADGTFSSPLSCSSAASEGTFAAVVVKRMTALIETADKTKAWEMEAVAEMMKAVHLITREPQEVPQPPNEEANLAFDGLLEGAGWLYTHGGKHHDKQCKICLSIETVRAALALSRPKLSPHPTKIDGNQS